MPEPSVITIEELTGPKRSVELHAAGLPFRGAEWAGQQKISTTWYPGNGTEATQQVLGPIELPSEWQGEWRTTRLVSSPCLYTTEGGQSVRVSRASTLRDVMEAIFRDGQRLRVTWAQGDRKIVREGLAEEWHFAHDRMDDIGWSVQWAWSGRGGKARRVVSFRGDKLAASFHDAIAQVNELVAEMTAAQLAQKHKGIPNSASSFGLGDLEALADAPFALMKQMQQFSNLVANRIGKVVDLVHKVATTPAMLAQQATDIAANAKAQFNQMADKLSREVPDAYSTNEQRASSVTKMAKYAGAAQAQAEKVAETMAKLEREARKRQSGLAGGRTNDRATTRDILTVHLSKQGDTFASISQRYYKTPDRAAELAKANDFVAYQVAPPPGTPIIVPVLAALDNRNKV